MKAEGLAILEDGKLEPITLTAFDNPADARRQYQERLKQLPVKKWHDLYFMNDDGSPFSRMFMWNEDWDTYALPEEYRTLSDSKRSLKQRQALPLSGLLRIAQKRIQSVYAKYDGNVYVAFSGGLDSQVVLHITRQMFPEVPAVFCNTGVEYKENLEVVRRTDNVEWLRPAMRFSQVVKKYGYPVISKDVAQKVSELQRGCSETLRHTRLHGDAKGNGKLAEKWRHLVDAPFPVSHKCCDIMKKNPSKMYEKRTGRVAITGEQASESRNRETEYLRHGCNMFDGKRPKSRPLSVWNKPAIMAYAKEHGLQYSRLYDMGWTQTGCFPCGFGLCQERCDLFEKNRFQRMKETHPKLYEWCMEYIGWADVLDWLGVLY